MQLIPRFSTGGAERLVLVFAEYFQARGFKVAVASVVGGGELAQQFRNLGAEVLVAEKNSYFNLFKNYKKLKEFKRNFKPDIIHTHVFSADVVGYLLRGGGRWLSTQHNVGAEHSWFRKLVLRFILRRAEKVVAVSPTVADFCARDLRLPAEKIVLIKNGIDIEKWLTLPAVNLSGKRELQLATIGRLEKQKGHIYLLRALAEVKNLSWHLQIYGAGSLEKKLKQRVRQLEIAEKITWHGVQSNMPEELKNIDIVIQPSLWEGRSLVVMEALAAGRLVIASPAAGEDLLEDKITGMIASPQELVRVLPGVFEHPKEAWKIAEAGRNYAKENFGIANNFAALEKLYA